MGREFELKFRADGEKIAAIREKYRDFTPISMETSYYDTPDLKLAFHQWTLRRRMENGVSVCTFKRPLADGICSGWRWIPGYGARGQWWPMAEADFS